MCTKFHQMKMQLTTSLVSCVSCWQNVREDAFFENPFWYRLLYMVPMFFIFRMRFYVGWILSECMCFTAALGAYPVATKPKCGTGPTHFEGFKLWSVFLLCFLHCCFFHKGDTQQSQSYAVFGVHVMVQQYKWGRRCTSLPVAIFLAPKFHVRTLALKRMYFQQTWANVSLYNASLICFFI